MTKCNSKIINVLLEVYWAEIGAIGIYMAQHTKYSSQGYSMLSELLEKSAKEEMKHADAIADRIIFLNGTMNNGPHMVPTQKKQNLVDILKEDIGIEKQAIERLNGGITTCFAEEDHGTRIILEKILQDEEKHIDELKTIHENVKVYGEQYIVTHLM